MRSFPIRAASWQFLGGLLLAGTSSSCGENPAVYGIETEDEGTVAGTGGDVAESETTADSTATTRDSSATTEETLEDGAAGSRATQLGIAGCGAENALGGTASGGGYEGLGATSSAGMAVVGESSGGGAALGGAAASNGSGGSEAGSGGASAVGGSGGGASAVGGSGGGAGGSGAGSSGGSAGGSGAGSSGGELGTGGSELGTGGANTTGGVATAGTGGSGLGTGGSELGTGGGDTTGGVATAGTAGDSAEGGSASRGGTAAEIGGSAGSAMTSGGTADDAGGASASGGDSGGAGAAGIAGAAPSAGEAGALGTGGTSSAFDPDTILDQLRLANDWFVTKYPDPCAVIVGTDRDRPSNLWTRAIYYEGLMALYGIEIDSIRKGAYYDYVASWGKTESWSGGPWSLTYLTEAQAATNYNADNQACGQTYLDLYQIEAESERIAQIQSSIDYMLDNFVQGAWWWIDAIQMSMPTFAKFGVLLNDTAYFDAMWWYYSDTRDVVSGGLFNEEEGLWWRDLHFSAGQPPEVMTASIHDQFSTFYPSNANDAYLVAPNGQNVYWSRGNGWVMAALVRVLDILPPTDAHFGTYLGDFQAMATALVPLQRTDGFWTESLMDPTHCSSLGLDGRDGPETSGTALFTYGLAWGLRKGYLDPSVFRPVLESAWAGLSTIALQSDGLVGYVQDTGDRPCTGSTALGPTTTANFEDYGVGCFLLAGSEVYRLMTTP